ncbi:MAG: RHS repeat-associated core domain-containing protein [Pseudoxanthomonas suwonensis]|nr:RHS repeat-associated core domain-containing protein [Pseudoxanthomonas suwonensis]
MIDNQGMGTAMLAGNCTQGLWRVFWPSGKRSGPGAHWTIKKHAGPGDLHRRVARFRGKRDGRAALGSLGKGLVLALIFLCAVWMAAAQAQISGMSYGQEAAARLKAVSDITRVGDDELGESISLYNGTVRWRFVDVSIPSNVGPAVEFARLHHAPVDGTSLHHMSVGGGVPDIPHIRMIVPTAFTGTWPASPPMGTSPEGIEFEPWLYGQGIVLEMGGNSMPLQARSADSKQLVPGMPGQWSYSTASGWVLRLAVDGNGERYFIGHAPDGLRYTFNLLTRSRYATVSHPWRTIPGGVTAWMHTDEMRLNVSRVEDRFGNRVDYSWTGARLDSITGISPTETHRKIVINYAAGTKPPFRVTSVVAHGRTWTYSADGVTYPDGSTSSLSVGRPTHSIPYAMNPIRPDEFVIDNLATCTRARRMIADNRRTAQLRHRSGVVVTYVLQFMRHGRTNMPFDCQQHGDSRAQSNVETTPYEDVWSIVERRVEGPGLAAGSRTYAYSITGPSLAFAPGSNWLNPGRDEAGPINTRVIAVTREDGSRELSVFGRDWSANDGKILRQEIRAPNSSVLRSTDYTYMTPAEVATQPFPPRYGQSLVPRSDPLSDLNLPLRRTVVVENGVSFTRSVDQFDSRVQETLVKHSNSQGASREIRTEYFNHLASWTLGQLRRRLVNGYAVQQVDFDAQGLPWKILENQRVVQTLAYSVHGVLSTVSDGRGNTTTLSNWHRGIPRNVKFADGRTQSASVNDSGWITSVVDENGFSTGYGYDAMGRLGAIVYPTGDTAAWNNLTQVFQQINATEYGIPAGHWRQTITTGNAQKITYYDALWRPLLVREFDSANAAGTQRFTRYAYDHEGRVTFEAYPSASSNPVTGHWREYDALGRIRSHSQDSEHGLLVTTTSYLANANGLYTLVTNPRGQQTRTWFQMFDEPDYSRPVSIWHPQGAFTHISRDVFGKPTRIRRSNNSSPTGGTVAVNRDYAYNVHQELCRTVEPETGATLMGYDAAGNLAWSAAGLPAGTACHATGNTTAINARKATRTYDARNRVTALNFPDGLGNTTWSYTPDGLLAAVVAQNGGSNVVTHSYGYNRRRLPVSERMQWGSIDWRILTGYNGNGHVASQTWPGTALTVDYQPNALGQPTRAGSFATGVSYHPTGAIRQFTYGNGVVHRMDLNARQIPSRLHDAHGTQAAIVDERYSYDTTGNVSAIVDATAGSRRNRTMTYDGLDRLTQAVSPMFGTASYQYDVLDNLTRVQVGATATSGARDHVHCHDASMRLVSLRTGSCSGTVVSSLAYDVQGNLRTRDSRTYTFDFGNRLRSVSAGGGQAASSYVYDGHGRRVRDIVGSSAYHFYDRNGRQMFGTNGRTNLHTQYVYLGGRLIATRERTSGTDTHIVKYQHTDALGSPVAVTGATRAVIERTEHEPYGRVANRAMRDGPGYTGHMEDASTGLNYMQQRYYDPGVGRFLSVDPVTAYSNGDMRFFNRYVYGFNNPYKFNDPDGRQSESVMDRRYVYPSLSSSQVGGIEAQHNEMGEQAFTGLAVGASLAVGPELLAVRGASMLAGRIASSSFARTFIIAERLTGGLERTGGSRGQKTWQGFMDGGRESAQRFFNGLARGESVPRNSGRLGALRDGSAVQMSTRTLRDGTVRTDVRISREVTTTGSRITRTENIKIRFDEKPK